MTLDQLITINRKVQVQQADGSLTTTMQKICDAWAAAYPIRGDERRMGQQNEAQADYRFRIVSRSDLNADDVIIWNGREYNIRFIADRGPTEIYMMIEAERGVAV